MGIFTYMLRRVLISIPVIIIISIICFAIIQLPPGDYADVPNFVTFPAGSAVGAVQTFTVATVDDATVENDETFTVLVSSLHAAFDGNDASGTGTIADNNDQIRAGFQ